MEKPITLSIIIPNYNYASYIGSCIDSILASDFDASMMEIIVVDDGSTDSSMAVIEDHLNSAAVNARIIRNDINLGVIASRNRGIVAARGTYLFFLDSDNYIYPDCLTRHVEALKQHPECCAAYAPIQEFNHQTGAPLQLKSNAAFDYKTLLQGNYIDVMAVFRRNDLLELGMFDANLPSGGWEDYELWLRLGKLNKKVWFIEGKPLSAYRSHNKSLTSRMQDDTYNILVYYLKAKHEISWKLRRAPHHKDLLMNPLHARAQLFFSREGLSAELFDPEKPQTTVIHTFNEEDSLIVPVGSTSNTLVFKLDEPGPLRRLRFDPYHDRVEINLHSLKLFRNGGLLDIPLKLTSNALESTKDTFLFEEIDPQIIICFDDGQSYPIDEVQIEIEYLRIGNEVLDLVLDIKNHKMSQLEENLKQARLFSSGDKARRFLEQQPNANPDKKQAPDMDKKKGVDGQKNRPRELNKRKKWHQRLAEKARLFREASLIKRSGLFDPSYYLQYNPDVLDAGMNPYRHYLQFGWRERRPTGPMFDADHYLSSYPDVKASDMNPLLHYIKHGKKEGRLPKPLITPDSLKPRQADIIKTDPDYKSGKQYRVAIVCHLFYAELAHELLGYFRNMPEEFDLFVTTTAGQETLIHHLIEKEIPHIQSTVIGVENKGRDIAPFIQLLTKQLKDYDLVCKVHTKQSKHDDMLADWRQYLLANLLGSQGIINRIIQAFEEEPGLGMIWPLPHPYLSELQVDYGWGLAEGGESNQRIAKEKFARLALDSLSPSFAFPCGSMFWFRPLALKMLADASIGPDDFEIEKEQIDGTLAHAIERLFGLFCKEQGFYHKTVLFTPSTYRAGMRHICALLPQPRTILFVAHDLQTAGAQILLLHILHWLHQHTAFNLVVLTLQQGHNPDRLHKAYSKLATVLDWSALLRENNEEEALGLLQKQIGEIALIYGNTIIASKVYETLSKLQAPIITHIHELEESIQKYTKAEWRENLRKYCHAFIACSNTVKNNLVLNHGISAQQIEVIHGFVRPDVILPQNQDEHRAGLMLPNGKTIIWGCGTIYWRKGTDLFIKTANILKQKGLTDFVFCWIGSNYWDAEAQEWGYWKYWEDEIAQNGLSDYILFLGEKTNPKDYFKGGDIYFLSSREDPFPLVCLEAAECALPILCFDGAGGMPGFVEEDAGSIIPYLDLGLAAQTLETWIKEPALRKSLGESARLKLLAQHTDDIAVSQILRNCHGTMQSHPMVSIIVVAYNHEKFLAERINSILQQTFRDVEIIILDDASTDGTYQEALRYGNHPAIKIIRSENNSGSPFHQWVKGIQMAKGEFIWIAEGDDACEPEFLETLLVRLLRDKSEIAYCQSNTIDAEGKVLSENLLIHTQELHPTKWLKAYLASGKREVIDHMFHRNTIPNVSACVFRRNELQQALDGLGSFRYAGDWLVYARILMQGSVSYTAKSLNHFRRHSNCITLRYKSLDYLEEILRIKEFIASHFSVHKSQIGKMKALLDKDYQIEGFVQNTAVPQVIERISRIEAQVQGRKRFVFITTNDGNPNGGSEQLWIKTALQCIQAGHDALVVIKNWNPIPNFIEDFKRTGIDILYKEEYQLERIQHFSPDLAVISLGDSDEGNVYYKDFIRAGIPYVIVNQLTKDPDLWPVNPKIMSELRQGYTHARLVFFTCMNNKELMERRIGISIPHYDRSYQPSFYDKPTGISFPSINKGLHIAMPARMLNLHKGQNLAIELLHMRKWKKRNLILNLYGDGPDKEQLMKIANKYKLENVRFHSPKWSLPQPGFQDIWEDNHILLMPSYMEGMPIVLVNAMLSGRVPVVTDVGGHSEIIQDNIDGFIAGQPTKEALDEALERAWIQMDRLEEIGQNARKKALSFLPANPIQYFLDKLLSLTNPDA